MGSHGDVGISVGTGGQAELQAPSWTQTSAVLPVTPPLQPMGLHRRVRCGGTPRPAAPRGLCSPPQSTPALRLASPHALQGKDLSPRRLQACQAVGARLSAWCPGQRPLSEISDGADVPP